MEARDALGGDEVVEGLSRAGGEGGLGPGLRGLRLITVEKRMSEQGRQEEREEENRSG